MSRSLIVCLLWGCEQDEVLTRWKGLKSIHKIVRKRRDKKNDKTSEEVAYYISSLTDVSSLKQAIRGHWAIENKLYHCLDVYFGHDASHKRTRNYYRKNVTNATGIYAK